MDAQSIPGNAGEAVRLFLKQNIQVFDHPKSTSPNLTLTERVIDQIVTVIVDRLHSFWTNEPFSQLEEVGLEFDKLGHKELSSPAPLVTLIKYSFHGATVKLESTSALAVTNDSCYVLRISPWLVSFAGRVIWQAPQG